MCLVNWGLPTALFTFKRKSPLETQSTARNKIWVQIGLDTTVDLQISHFYYGKFQTHTKAEVTVQ